MEQKRKQQQMVLNLLKKLEVDTMAFINSQGIKVSSDCSDLIKELKEDIMEFGGDKIVAVWCKDTQGVTIYTNYDFIEDEKPITKSELNEDEYIKEMTMSALLILLETQNSIL